MEYTHITHASLSPFYDSESEILILGSLPSIESRRAGFYYSHPSNRFFLILSHIFNEEEPKSIDQRKEFCHRHHIALYDVIYECDIKGSSDSSIKNPVIADLSLILKSCHIKAIFTTGNLASKLYRKYIGDNNIPLPSSSAANVGMTNQQLFDSYSVILEIIEGSN